MRDFISEVANIPIKIIYPDSVAFAFNPLYCIIQGKGVSQKIQLNVENNGIQHRIDAYLVSGDSKIEFSNIVQLFFNDYINKRSLNIKISISFNGKEIFSDSFIVLWGTLGIGERYRNVGFYDNKENKCYSKTLIWFKNYPFTVSMFSSSKAPVIMGKEDNGYAKNISEYGSKNKYPFGNQERYGIFEMVPSIDFMNAKRNAEYHLENEGALHIFDETFDETFYGIGIEGYFINLIVSNKREGFYLRWIDRVGELQYFLFDKGTTTIKNSLDKYEKIEDDIEYGGMYFPNLGRNLEVRSEEICKCCAVSLPGSVYKYVSTILTSPVIDLLISYDSDEEQVWLPVNIVGSSHDYDYNENLHDLIISFNKPVTTKPKNGSVTNNKTLLDVPRPTGYKRDKESTGFYLRWVDYLDITRYQYFVKGTSTLKNSPDKFGQSSGDIIVGNKNFGEITRTIHIASKETVKCCAVSLSDEEFEIVSTIVRSNKIDLYLGDSIDGQPIWLPVNISSSSHEFNHKELLHDLTISFSKPSINAQVL